MTRQIVLDTETTGLSPESGDRLIEIGCIELVKRKFTGNNLHIYINPQRDISQDAIEVHGITNEFLNDKPVFQDVAQQVIDFIKGAELIIHNAAFDVGFLNYELKHYVNHSRFKMVTDYCSILDSLKMARKLHPGQRNSLDALCKRYDVDNRQRQLHGALLDAQLLAQVYLAMTGGQETLMFDEHATQKAGEQATFPIKRVSRDKLKNLLVRKATEAELSAHADYLKLLQKTD